MRIQGSLKEFSLLLLLASKMKGEFFYFLPEGDIWMMYDGGKVIYFHSHLDISHHSVIEWTGLINLQNTIIREKKRNQGRGSFQEWSEDFFRLEEHSFRIGLSEDDAIKMNTHIEKVKMFSQFADKFTHLREMIKVERAPYIKIKRELLQRYDKDYVKYHKFHGTNVSIRSATNLLDKELRNVMWLEDNENLAILRKKTEHSFLPARKFSYEDGFFIPEEYWDYSFSLSDANIQLMMMVADNESIDEFRILLYKDYYVVDAYDADLRFRMWIERKKA